MSIGRIDHFAIEVKNLEQYVSILEKIGDLKLIRWGTVGRAGQRMVMLGDGTGMKIELTENPATDAPRFLHVAFRSNDVDEACSTLADDGWRLLRGPNVLPAAHALSALFKDDSGLHLQIISYQPTSPDIVEWDSASGDPSAEEAKS
jgi:hypothetical protein